MKNKKIPMRKCTGCGNMKPKKELIRIVKSQDTKDEAGNIIKNGDISVDLIGKKQGRGAYVCKSMHCLELARKARRFEKAFSCKIPDDVYKNLEEELKKFDFK